MQAGSRSPPLTGEILCKLYTYLYISLTNRFHVAIHLFSNRSQMTSKCGKNKKVAHEAKPSVLLMFLLYYTTIPRRGGE